MFRKNGFNAAGSFVKILIIFMIITADIVFPCVAFQQNGTTTYKTFYQEPVPPGQKWNISIYLGDHPKINQPVDLILETQTLTDINYSGIEIGFNLQDGIEVVGGDTFWKGNPQNNKKITLKTKVKFKEAGDWKITGTVRKNLASGDYVEDTKSIFVSISETSSKITNSPPENHWKNTVGYTPSTNDEGVVADIKVISPLKLNKKSNLEYRMVSSFDIPDARISLVFPDKGINIGDKKSTSKKTRVSEFTNGDLDIISGNQISWRGGLLKDEPFNIGLTVTPDEVGKGYIFATFTGTRPDGSLFTNTEVLNIEISSMGDGRYYKKETKFNGSQSLLSSNNIISSAIDNYQNTSAQTDLQLIDGQPNNYSTEFLIPGLNNLIIDSQNGLIISENQLIEYQGSTGVQQGEKYLLENGLTNGTGQNEVNKYSPEFNITAVDVNDIIDIKPVPVLETKSPKYSFTQYTYFGNETPEFYNELVQKETFQEPILPENNSGDIFLSESTETVTFEITNEDDDGHYFYLYVDGTSKGYKYISAGYTGYQSYVVSSALYHTLKILWYDDDDSSWHSISKYTIDNYVVFNAYKIIPPTTFTVQIYNKDDDFHSVYIYLDPTVLGDGEYMGRADVDPGFTTLFGTTKTVKPGYHTIKIKWYDADDGQTHTKQLKLEILEGKTKNYYFELDKYVPTVPTTLYTQIYNGDDDSHNVEIYLDPSLYSDGTYLGYVSIPSYSTKYSSQITVTPGWHTIRIKWYDADDEKTHTKQLKLEILQGQTKYYNFELDKYVPTTLSVRVQNADADDHDVKIYIDPTSFDSGYWMEIYVYSGSTTATSMRKVDPNEYHKVKIKWHDDDDGLDHIKESSLYVKENGNQNFDFTLDNIEKSSSLYVTITNKDDDLIRTEIYVDDQYWGYTDINSGNTFVSIDKPLVAGLHTVMIRWQEPDNDKWYEKKITYSINPNERKNFKFEIDRYNPTEPLSVKGRLAYYDENLDTIHYIKNAKIELLDSEPLGLEDHISWSQTDSEGYYYIDKKDDGTPIYNDDGLLQNGLDIFVKVYAENSAAKVTSESSSIYVAKTDVYYDAPGGLIERSLNFQGSDRGAFNIFNSLVEGAAYIDIQPDTPAPPQVRAIWPDNDADASSEYGNGIIYIEGPSSIEPDEWDESVIIHEYGHFIFESFADLSPPTIDYGSDGIHTWLSHETKETAWVEGWALFFQSAVRHNNNYPDYDKYVESGWSASLEYAIEQGDPRGDDVEGAIASVLWDIYDSNSDIIREGTDSVNLDFDEIWYITDKYDPDTSSSVKNHPWTIYDFWNGWVYRSYGNEDNIKTILKDRGIFVDPEEDILPDLSISSEDITFLKVGGN